MAPLVLIGVGEVNPGHALRGLATTLGAGSRELLLCHVVDNGARGEMGMAHGFGPHRALGGHRARAVLDAEREAAAGILEEAAREAPGAARIVEEGEPGRVLCRLARERGVTLVVVGARNGLGPDPPHPHSVGSTARFVLDHAPCPILLVRAAGPA
ncbi:MAG: universal stress protein [Candidatus Dormibacteraceae bacterium]